MNKKAFLFGMLFMNSVISLFQDALGKDGYIEFARTHWVSGWIAVPLALLGISVSLNWLTHNKE